MPVDSKAALAEAICRLYRDPNLRQSLGEAGQRAVQQFNAPRVAGLFLAEIRKHLAV